MNTFQQQIARIRARVNREGRVATVSASELLPGDIVLLAAGDIVPADCRLLSCAQLWVQEGVLTGESGSIEKSAAALCAENLPIWEQCNRVFYGTHVTAGSALGVVTAVGACTEYGRIVALTEAVQHVSIRSIEGGGEG